MATPDDLISVSEIRRMYDVAKNSAWRWTNRNDFPEPAVVTSIGRFWRRKDVEAWAKANLPLRAGRPPKPSAP